MRAPGYLEGGDFFPAGKDLCFIGVGLRSNAEAVEQLLREDLFGTTRVAVVRDELECSQCRMARRRWLCVWGLSLPTLLSRAAGAPPGRANAVVNTQNKTRLVG